MSFDVCRSVPRRPLPGLPRAPRVAPTDPETFLMPDDANPAAPAIEAYHAHVYYDPAATRDRAERLRERIGAVFPQARLGRWHDELVGPHPQSMYQVEFPSGMLASFVPWLMLNRD